MENTMNVTAKQLELKALNKYYNLLHLTGRESMQKANSILLQLFLYDMNEGILSLWKQ